MELFRTSSGAVGFGFTVLSRMVRIGWLPFPWYDVNGYDPEIHPWYNKFFYCNSFFLTSGKKVFSFKICAFNVQTMKMPGM